MSARRHVNHSNLDLAAMSILARRSACTMKGGQSMVCPRCRAVNRSGDQACFRCGYPLMDDDEQPDYGWYEGQADQQPPRARGYASGAGWGDPTRTSPRRGPYGASPEEFGPPGPYYQPGQPSRPVQPYQQYTPQQPYQQYTPQQPYQQYPSQEPYGAYGGYGGYGPYSSYGPQTFSGQQPYGMGEPEARSRHPLTAVLIVGVVILFIAMAGGGALLVSRMHSASANTPGTATATPAVPVGFKTYTDPGGAFKLFVPTDWSTQTPNTTTQSPYSTVFANPDETGVLTVASFNGTFNQSTLATSEKSVFVGMSRGGGGPGTYSHLQGPTTLSLAGEKWTQETADVAVANGTTLHAVVLLANHAGHGYAIAYAAKQTSFKSLDTKDYQVMVHSFAFLK